MEERKRALVLGRVVAGRLTIPEAALLLGLSERSVWRLKSRFVAAELDPTALAHGDAGRVAAHRLDLVIIARVSPSVDPVSKQGLVSRPGRCSNRRKSDNARDSLLDLS
jgi:Homeodomain-like domain